MRKQGTSSSGGIGIRGKLVLLLLLVGLIPFLINAVADQIQAGNALTERAGFQLESIREVKKNQVVGYLQERQGDMVVLADLLQSLRHEAIAKLKAIEGTKIQGLKRFMGLRQADVHAVASSPTTITAIQEFFEAFREDGNKVNGSLWNGYKEQYGPWFKTYMADHGYYDILLIAEDGTIVYSGAEESDLGQNVISGTLRNSGVGRLFAKSMKTLHTAIEDYAPYAPSNNQQSLFVGAPVKQDDRTLGMVVMQVSTEAVNSIVQERAGMHDSFESYMVGDKGTPTLHSDRVVKDGKIGDLKTGPDTDAVLAGKSGVIYKIGTTGLFELSSYAPVDISGVEWGLITNGALSEAVVPQGEGEVDDLLHKYQKAYGYYDIFLVDPQGYVFYSVEEEADYQTNMMNGKYSDSNLGRLIQKVASTKKAAMADYERYEPSQNNAAAFFAAPILEKGNLVMIVAAQVADTDIQSMMFETSGLGETGETFLVGEDLYLRSDTRLGAKLFEEKIETDLMKNTFKDGNARIAFGMDYRPKPVMGASTPLFLKKELGAEFDWVLMAKMDTDEALAAVDAIRNRAIGIGLVIALVVFGVAWFVGGGFARPIVYIARVVRQVATERDLTLQAEVTSKDEIGEMGNEFNNMLQELNRSFTEVQEVSLAVAENAQNVAGRASANRERAEVEVKQSEKTRELLETMGATAQQVAQGSKAQQESAQKSQHSIAELLQSMDSVNGAVIKQSEEAEIATDRVAAMGQTGAQVVATSSEQGKMVMRVTASMNEINSAVQKKPNT
ncbi:MAG: methyl-accepting chemotaxis protein, partial [Candidatus Electrothrix sp. AR3]|nr:methyl-accepting chemotaxis protein [Candidatus Electrothrix sp. AR3]